MRTMGLRARRAAGDAHPDGFGEPSYEFQNTFSDNSQSVASCYHRVRMLATAVDFC